MVRYFSSIEEVAGEDVDVLREHVLINYEHYDSKDINEGWDGKVKGVYSRDGTYTCFVKVVGMNGEGRKEFTTSLNLIK